MNHDLLGKDDMSFEVAIVDSNGIAEALSKVKKISARIGFNQTNQVKIATAMGELTNNILIHAKKGSVKSKVIHEGGHSGIEIIAEDYGPGIHDIKLAMKDGYSTVGSLGIGLPGTKRLMDEFEWDKDRKVGTKITIRKWLS